MNLSIFPGVKSYFSEKETNTTIYWVSMGIFVLMILVVLFPLLKDATTSGFPLPLIDMIQDCLIRLGLFVFFIGLMFFAMFLVVMKFGVKLLESFLFWLFGVRYGRIRNIKLEEEMFTSWLREMVSPLSLTIYILIAIISLGMYKYTWAPDNILILLITILMPFTLLAAYNMSVAERKTCINEKEFEQRKFFFHTSLISAMLMGALTILAYFFSLDLFVDRIYLGTVGSSVLVLLAPPLADVLMDYLSFFLIYLNTIKGKLIPLFVSVMVVAFSLYLFLGHFRYPVKTYKTKVKTFLNEIKIFFITFICVQLILEISQLRLGVATFPSILVSLAVSSLNVFLRFSWKNIIIKPWQCPKCKKDLSSFKGDILFCPYCSGALDSEEEQPYT